MVDQQGPVLINIIPKRVRRRNYSGGPPARGRRGRPRQRGGLGLGVGVHCQPMPMAKSKRMDTLICLKNIECWMRE